MTDVANNYPHHMCQCGHPDFHHIRGGGRCITVRIFGNTNIPNENTDAELHMGRWQRRCPCDAYAVAGDEQ